MTQDIVREWRPASGWRLLPLDTTRPCRFMEGKPLKWCRAKAVAEFQRGYKRKAWWPYCADHLYGRRINNGVVESYQVAE